jgi:hypothetical protein
VFNKAVQEMAHPHPDQRRRFWELSFCTLRQVKITNPFWTYCKNFHYGKSDIETMPPQQPRGGITASGLYEGYVRIPWHDAVEPEVSVPCTCLLCGRFTERGITLPLPDGVLGFCTNRHYVEWWNTQHPESCVDLGHFTPPEEYYKTREPSP